jgi:hypothetical protein
MARLHMNIPDGVEKDLEKIAADSGRTKTAVIVGMIEHWAVVTKEHERRGFRVVPVPGASFAAAMIAERAGDFDQSAAGPGAPSAGG